MTSRPRVEVSVLPHARLLILLKVSGAARALHRRVESGRPRQVGTRGLGRVERVFRSVARSTQSAAVVASVT